MTSMRPLSLRHNFAWTFVGNGVYAGSQWGMLVLLAKLGSPEMVGQFTLGLAITAPVVMLTNLQLRVVQSTDASEQYRFGHYLALRLLATALALGVIIAIAFGGGYRSETAWVVVLMGLAKAIEAVSDICHGVLQQKEQLDRLSQSLMIKGLLSLLLLGIGVALTGSLIVGSLCLIGAWLAVLVFYDLPCCQQLLRAYPNLGSLRPCWQWAALGPLLGTSLPLGIVMMLISLNTNIPRYFIEGALGERELGIFSALAYLMIVGSMVVNALGNSASPRLARYYAQGNRQAFGRLTLQMVLMGAGLGLGAVGVSLLAGRPLLTLIYRPEYAEQVSLLVWLMVAAGLGYVGSFLGYIVSAARYFRVQVPLFMGVTGVSAIACWWLLPQYQLLGAAYALTLSAAIQLLISLGVFFHAFSRLKPARLKPSHLKP